jgi:hypothetical protein
MKEIKNFLSIEEFEKLQNLILDLEFPWRIRNSMTNLDKNIYFTFSFFNEGESTSEFYRPFIKPILKKLNCKAVIQVKANMILNKLFDKSGWHTDYNFNNTTAIFYLNNCNGGTEFKIKNKIKFVKAEENKILIFDSNIEHRARTSTDVDKRYIINFNYF